MERYINIMLKVLKTVVELRTLDTNSIAEKTQLKPHEVEAAIATILANGYLKEIACTTQCGTCPLRKVCIGGARKQKAYILTEKGKKLLEMMKTSASRHDEECHPH